MDKICTQCQQQFTITAADSAFYRRIAVPPPRLCPPCRLQRRMAWRNEKTLYQRQCDLCQQSIISIYRSGVPFPVYCQTCWWSDRWDPLSYGQTYDATQDFFIQLQQLRQRVPRLALINTNSENSAYTNYAGNDKNCYLIVGNANGHNENCAYGKCFSGCRDTVDGLYLQDCELVYNCIDCRSCYRVAHAQYCSNCSEAMYLEDCNNCQNCIGCKGLRNKQYHMFNQPYSKADYERRLDSLQLDTAAGHEALRQQWEQFRRTVPSRYAHMIKAEQCSGDYITNSTHCQYCFDVNETERCAYINHAVTQLSDCYDVSSALKADLCYDCMSLADVYNCRFCNIVWWSVRDLEYCDLCFYTQSCFGCIGLHKNQFCILNTQYTQTGYEELVQQIRMQWPDYGEFPSIQHSPFAYNETLAQEYFPLTQTQVLDRGWQWHNEREASAGQTSVSAANQCSVCHKPFRMIPLELALYRQLILPSPKMCFDCRHQQRLQQKGGLQLWPRRCMCEHNIHGHTQRCPIQFETSYAPDRPTLVYCEQCYQKEVY